MCYLLSNEFNNHIVKIIKGTGPGGANADIGPYKVDSNPIGTVKDMKFSIHKKYIYPFFYQCIKNHASYCSVFCCC